MPGLRLSQEYSCEFQAILGYIYPVSEKQRSTKT